MQAKYDHIINVGLYKRTAKEHLRRASNLYPYPRI